MKHSVWFGQESFHTNNVQGVWSKNKRWTNDFAVSNGNVIHKFEAKGINIEDYFNGWICFVLFHMRSEHLHLTHNKKIELLSEYLQ